MNNITASEAKFRQRVIKYSYKHGVTNASIRFHRCRNAIYGWREDMAERVRKALFPKVITPQHHPNEHTAEDKQLILKHYPYYKDDIIMLWDALKKGYSRCYTSLVRVIKNWIKP